MAAESKILPVIEDFTTGPWKFGDTAGPNGIRVYRHDCHGFRGHVVLASCVNSEGDAALMAAAPDLYRIAHEQREVIRKQDEALRAAFEPLELYHAYGWPDRAGVRAKVKALLAAAAPFLED